MEGDGEDTEPVYRSNNETYDSVLVFEHHDGHGIVLCLMSRCLDGD